jgi:protein involved in polysaccharide export with SLBB domain
MKHAFRWAGPYNGTRAVVRVMALLSCCVLSGCAAMTNPVARGVPAHTLPPEMLSESKEGDQMIPMSLLSQAPPDAYRLDAGDVLGVYIEGVLDEKSPIPNVRIPERTMRVPERGGLPSALGYPINVHRDGTVALPGLKPLLVKDLTVEEAEAAIRKAYVTAKILQAGKERIFVNLLHKRQVQVLVFRRDLSASGQFFDNAQSTRVGLFSAGAELIGRESTGTGYEISLPAYENDVLHALALTGGFPGTNAVRKIVIYRDGLRRRPAKNAKPGAVLGRPVEVVGFKAPPGAPYVIPTWNKPDVEFLPEVEPAAGTMKIIEIPLRLRPGEQPSFGPEDVVLHQGDVVFVEAAPVETFYTGGLLPSAEHILPRDYDLDVVEAVARVRGPMINGAFGGNNLAGNLIQPGIGQPSPRLLTVVRRMPDGAQIPILVDLHRALVDPSERILVQAGDVLVLQETPCQAMVRYFTQNFEFFGVFTLFRHRDAIGTAAVIAP